MELCRRVVNEGAWIYNDRTGKRCLTLINASFEYDVRNGVLPVLTTKRLAWKPAIAEMLGYLRGYRNAAQFRALGTKTWDANSNADWWQRSAFCLGEGDLGRCYGIQGREWRNPEGKPIDQLRKVVDDLSKGVDDRREIVTFWNPGELDRACLAACMHTHTFSLVNGNLYLTSYQRSDDLPLGHGFNQVQVAWLLRIIAQITGNLAHTAFHHIVNAHIYEDQLQTMVDVQLPREPRALPTLTINPDIKSLEDLETWVTLDDFVLEGYDPHPAIKYPFSV